MLGYAHPFVWFFVKQALYRLSLVRHLMKFEIDGEMQSSEIVEGSAE